MLWATSRLAPVIPELMAGLLGRAAWSFVFIDPVAEYFHRLDGARFDLLNFGELLLQLGSELALLILFGRFRIPLAELCFVAAGKGSANRIEELVFQNPAFLGAGCFAQAITRGNG